MGSGERSLEARGTDKKLLGLGQTSDGPTHGGKGQRLTLGVQGVEWLLRVAGDLPVWGALRSDGETLGSPPLALGLVQAGGEPRLSQESKF